MNHFVRILAVVSLVWSWPRMAVAQPGHARIDLGVQLVSTRSAEFDKMDVGVSGRFSWYPIGLIGIEAEIASYPRDFPDQRPFSRGRMEGLFGVTIGPSFDRLRPFAMVRPGFVTFRDAPQPIVCILIFPPPLSCELASGRTLRAFDIGGGVEVFATRKTFLRVDAGDRLLKYPGPVFDNNRAVRLEGFWSHDLRFSLGAGLKF